MSERYATRIRPPRENGVLSVVPRANGVSDRATDSAMRWRETDD